MNQRTSKLIDKFSKLDLVKDSRLLATSYKPKRIIKKMYKRLNSIERAKFRIYMNTQIGISRGLDVVE